MHELVEDVLPFLVAFFVLDALALTRVREWLLVAAGARFCVQKAGWSLVGLSPFAEVVSVVDASPRLGVDAVYLEGPAPGPGDPLGFERIPLDGLKVGVEERKLRLGERAVALPSPAAAWHAAGVLRDLAGRSGGARAGRVRAVVQEATDLRAVRAVRAVHERFQRVLGALGLGLWAVTFVVLPVGVALRWERGPGLVAVLLTALAIVASILGVAWVALRRLGQTRGAAATALLPFVFFPPAAAHAPCALFRDLYVRFDPLAVAGVFLRPADFRSLARSEVHRLRREAEVGGEVAEWAALREKAWTRLFAELGTSLADVLRPPAKRGDDAFSYCPLCGGEYRAGFAVCTECGGPLEAMA